MKQCFKCKAVKPLDDFYVYPRMADGHLNKCKECTKSDVSANYRATQPEKAAYERERHQRPERRAAVAVYQARRRKRSPEKYRANAAVGNAVRDGRLIRQPCEVCGDPKSQAHHDDYNRPLNVRWLCFIHHREFHGQRPLREPHTMTDLRGQGRLFGPPSAREQYEQPPSLQPAAERLSRQCEAILAALRDGPKTNKELAAISLKYTSRISDLRKAGHVIKITEMDHRSGHAVYAIQ